MVLCEKLSPSVHEEEGRNQPIPTAGWYFAPVTIEDEGHVRELFYLVQGTQSVLGQVAKDLPPMALVAGGAKYTRPEVAIADELKTPSISYQATSATMAPHVVGQCVLAVFPYWGWQNRDYAAGLFSWPGLGSFFSLLTWASSALSFTMLFVQHGYQFDMMGIIV